MGKESWLEVSPSSGIGDSTLINTGEEHKGRLVRGTAVIAITDKVESAKSYQVKQEASPEYIILDKTLFTISQNQQKVVISGKSNSKNITFSFGKGNGISFQIPENYIANGLSTENGSDISGDPGAKGEFNFYAEFLIPKNTVGQRIGKIAVTGFSSLISEEVTIIQESSTYTISYQKGEHIKSIDKISETVKWGGSATAVATIPSDTAQFSYSFLGWYEGGEKVSSDLLLNIENIVSDRTFTAIGSRETNRYSLSFVISPEGSGTVAGSGNYDYGSLIKSTANPAVGYNFIKWIDEEGNEFFENPYSSWEITKNRTIQAIFQIKSCDINLKSKYRIAESGDFLDGENGGTVFGGGTFNHGESVTIEAVPSEGYSFDGWYDGELKISEDLSYTFNADSSRNLTARFQRMWFTLKFIAGPGGTVSPTSARVEYGGSASSTATPDTGHLFSGWSNGVETLELTVTNVTKDETYAASFGMSVNIVTYKKGKGIISVTPEIEAVEYGSNAEGSVAELEEGYNFDGWYNEEEVRVSQELKYAPLNVRENLEFTAKGVIKTFSIECLPQYRDADSIGSFTDGTNGGTVTGSGEYDYGSKATLTASAKVGYTFQGWYNSEDTRISDSSTYEVENITSSMTVYARFQKNWFSVTYSKGVGVVDLTKTTERVAYNGTVTSEKAVASTGYNTPTWEKTSGTGTLNVLDGIATLSAIQSDCTLVASATINVYSISYSKNANIASLTKESESVNYGGTATCEATLLENTVQLAYSFDGWYENGEKVGEDLILSIENISSDRSFEARGVSSLRKYTLTVVDGTGSGTYDYGTKVTISALEIEGKAFVKWSDGVTTKSREVTVTGDATYTAEYSINSYTVTYLKGTGIDTISRESEIVNWGGNSVGCTATVIEGYTFDGWYEGETKKSSSLTYAPTDVRSNMSLTAKATLNSYTVTPQAYYRNTDGTGNYTLGTSGGTVSGGGTVNHGANSTVIASVAAGYNFDGWYSAGESGGSLLSSSLSYTISNVTSSVTVYARFTKKYYTITYQVGDYVTSVSRSSERVAHGTNAVGSTMTVNSTTAQYSYGVDGWYNGSSKVSSGATFAPTGVTANATYLAKGTRTLRSYTVTYNKGNYISSVSRASESVNYGSNAQGSTATVMASNAQYSYGFDGWYNGSSKVSSGVTYAPTNITGALTLEARGTRSVKSYTVSIGMESSSSSRGSVSGGGSYNYGAQATVTCTKKNSQDVFDGWYENGRKVSSNLSYSFTVNGARNLVAKILYLDVSLTSLSFEATGGSSKFSISTNTSWKIS